MESKNSQDPFANVLKKEEEIYTSDNFKFIVNWDRGDVIIMLSAKNDTPVPGVLVVKFDQIKELHDAVWEIKYMAERGV